MINLNRKLTKSSGNLTFHLFCESLCWAPHQDVRVYVYYEVQQKLIDILKN